MTARLEFRRELTTSPTPAERRREILANPGFGKFFTDHMITARWTPERGWHDAVLRPYGPFSLDPATAVFHYAQEIFEGLKAYRHSDGSIWTFRPDVNAARFQRSARRMALPELPVEDFVGALDLLIQTDQDWVPSGGEKSLYLRPFMFASEPFLGVRPAQDVTFAVIASPAASYFAAGVKPVSIWLSEEYTRAAVGGTGAAKCGGNYAASLLAQQEAIENGCDQVVFLDAVERRWVEELGGMNIYFVYDNGLIVTPELTGTILEGVTRAAILELAADLGYKVDERRVDINEWRQGVATGRITEVFACGTAAVVTPVGQLKWRGGQLTIGKGECGPVTARLRQQLLDIQYGRADDTHGWLHRVC
ncbi:branched-chain amino acid aminotransferase [Thermasporomyces composti]|jgi:branched-chain amino acid aminotransferase|uniref:Branched-chain-amino-acid aminotransferase n=1 Tax=Thermasporomyces composti TaxID=696763 RepID=A0A3D9V1H9_THECX|nr:branched-chain amino acid aminotransferase [Thermasporomyces composti]REF35246.1 branched chain amino acid aminotransferase [Thermasporomyces composti]